MSVVCNNCKNYVQETANPCPVCGQTVIPAPQYTFRDLWREAWELDKRYLPYFVAGFVVLLLMFLFVLINSKWD